MPEFTPLVIVISSLVVLAEVAVSSLMYRKGYVERWRALFFLLSYKACTDIAIATLILPLMDQELRAVAYFYAFWIAKAGEWMLQYWALWQIIDKLLPRSGRVRAAGLICFYSAIALTLAIAACCSMHSSVPYYLRPARFALHIGEATSLAWCLTFLLVVFSSRAIGILWRAEMLVVAAGFALHVAMEMLSIWAAAIHIPDSAASILSAGDIGLLLSLVLWIFYFRSRRHETKIDRELADEIRRDLQALRATNI